jgi:lysophospholipase L1-like esterase
MKYLPPCLMSHNPLDLVVIMLGTNDTKERFGMNACTIAQCAQQMVLLAKQYALGRDGKPSRVLLVSPFWWRRTWRRACSAPASAEGGRHIPKTSRGNTTAWPC